MNEPFTPLEQDSWGGLLWAHSRMMGFIESDLQEKFQISHPEFEVLLRLGWAQDHRARIQDLAADSVLTRSGVSRLVDRLEKAGYVTKEVAPEDRRGAYAVLSLQGQEHFERALKAHVKIVNSYFLQHFSELELTQMAEFWKRIPRS
ncbi:MAG: MarR family transcriptional regulator [Spirochaetales bacterium]